MFGSFAIELVRVVHELLEAELRTFFGCKEVKVNIDIL